MNTKLKNIANVGLGYSFRSKIQKEDKGNVEVVQMKDLTDDFRVNLKSLDTIELNDYKDHHIIRKGDIIFKARGIDTTACFLDNDLSNVVLAAPLIKIRIESKNVLPKYIFWYLNQKYAQAYFNSRTKGTAQKMINKQSIEELEIEIPSFEQQHKIVEIAQLAEKEQRLLEILRIKKSEYVSEILLKNIKESNHGN